MSDDRQWQVALWEPEIPPNTGNIARLCAATGAVLHLIGRLGFRTDDRSLRRAGLDYWHEVEICRHSDRDAFLGVMAGRRLLCFSARAVTPYTHCRYQAGDVLVFGSESRGLPERTLSSAGDRVFGIPMPGGKVRSLNLAVAVGIVVYEALRQQQSW